MSIGMIEDMRRRHKISVSELCRAAGVSTRCYDRIKAGKSAPRRATVAKLNQALAELRRGDRGRAPPSRMMFRLVLAMLAREAGLDVGQVLAHNPQQKATASAEWTEISKLRDVACYMLNTMLGLPNAEVARAAGVTPPAITVAIRKVEDKREEHPELETVFSIFEAAVR